MQDGKTQERKEKRRSAPPFASGLGSCLPGMAHRVTLVVLLSCLSAHAVPTVDFTNRNSNGTATELSATEYSIPLSIQNNMDAEPSANPYNDFVSEIMIEGIYSATAPRFSDLPNFWGSGAFGYQSVVLVDPVRRLWTMRAGLSGRDSARIGPGIAQDFTLLITLPTGIAASAIRYGAVAAQGKTSVHGYQPEDPPDTFVGPVGVEYPRPGVSLGVAGGQVGLGLVGLVAGRGYRVLRSADLAEWHEAARITVPAEPWPESGRGDREWSEATVLPGRRFYRLEWEEP